VVLVDFAICGPGGDFRIINCSPVGNSASKCCGTHKSAVGSCQSSEGGEGGKGVGGEGGEGGEGEGGEGRDGRIPTS
jgi:hypothetical protein